MKILVDTHILIWLLSDSKRFDDNTMRILENKNNQLLVSSISVAEISIKNSIGKLQIPKNFYEEVEKQFEYLVFKAEHAKKLNSLPDIHKDPFDRMLICQAMHEKIKIITKDILFKKYPVQVIYGNW